MAENGPSSERPSPGRSGRRSRCRTCRWPVEEFPDVGWLHVPYPWLGADHGDEPGWCTSPEPSAVIQPPNQDDEPPPWREPRS